MNKLDNDICKIKNIIHNHIKSNNFNKLIILENDLVYKCYIKKFIPKKYFFGIVVNIYNNLEIVKIFIKILNQKYNFQNILFCFIDEGSNSIFDIFKTINPNFNYILLETKNKKNIFGLENKGFLYPAIYVLGIEILKENAQYFGILSSKSWISNNYFNKAKILINKFKSNSFISLFNHKNYNLIKNFDFNNEKLLVVNKLNELSLFFDNKIYQKNKNNFLNINKKNFTNFNHIFKDKVENIIITKDSYIQNIDIKNKEDLIYLLNPNKYEDLVFDSKFKCTNEKLIRDIIFTSNSKEYLIKYELMLSYDKKCLYQKIEGGFGNQLFMLFNLLSLSQEYNLNIIPYFNKDYVKNYKKENNVIRKSSNEYNILKNIKFYNEINNHNFTIYQEKEFIYNKINLNNDNNYELIGFFQSYKYFWKNINFIKKKLLIDFNLINNIKSFYEDFKKNILSIHVRLGDYVNKSDFHPVQTINYFKKSLSYYDLNNYQIILFSDDYKHAIEILKPLNLSFIKATEYSNEDEIQFYMLMLSHVRICSNSSFSLMSCYLNEIYYFVEDCEYIFPNNWFGPKGPKFKMEDLMLNYKFKVININNEINIEKKYDVISTLHSKDLERYQKYIKYNKKFLLESNKYYYISNSNYNLNNLNFINENTKYPFTKLDIINYIKDYIPNYRWGWYYQQLLKLYIFRIKNINIDNILIFDTDLLLLKNLKFFENDKFIIYKRNTGDGKIHKPYKTSINYIFPKLNVNENDSGICHTMIFNRDIINHLLNKIENIHKKEPWKVCLDSIIDYIKLNGFTDSIFSEYELYYNFAKMYYKERFIIKKNLNYLDISYKQCIKRDLFNDFSKNINFIADHHYQSRNSDDYKIDNLIEDEKIELRFLESLIKKYKNKKFNEKYNNDYLKTFINKLFKFLSFDYVIKKLKKHFTEENINSIINIECKNNVIKFRENIDNLIKKFLKNNKLDKNHLINKINIFNLNLKKDNFYFGIIVPVFNRYYITKIFLEFLKKNVNFDSIVFCIVDDGSNSNIINELNDLKNYNIKCVIVQCKRQIHNIFGSDNTIVPGSLYPLTLYIGHEIIKKYCKILGVLDSDAVILPNYFKICEIFTKKINMDNNIFSGFNSYSDCHKISGKDNINKTDILYKNMVGGISQFYSVKLYNQFKYKFTGEESDKYWAYDYDFQISKFMMKNNKKYICLKNSIVQHIGIKSTMIRVGIEHNHNESDIVKIIYNLLINPNTKKDINIEFDFDSNLKFDRNNLDSIFYKSELKNYMNNNIMELNSSNEINKLEQLNKLEDSNKNFFFINKIFYINLDVRKDRKKIIEDQFNKFGINNYERFSAIKPEFNKKYDTNFINEQIKKYLNNEQIVNDLFENYDSKYILNFEKNYIKSQSLENRKKYILGHLGIKLSFINLFKKAKNIENILIIEDDALFHEDFNKHIEILNKNMTNLNFDYDMIWLSPNWLYKNNNGILNRCKSYKYINENLALVGSEVSIDNEPGSTYNNAGTIYSKKCRDYILDIFENSKQIEIDPWFKKYIQSRNNVYTTIPNLVRQRVEKSNIEGYEVNYDKDLHYKTRMKFNIFSIVKEKDKDLYLENLKNNLQKMIGYEKIYYISNKKLFNNEILHFIDNKNLENNIDELKKNFKYKVNDNEIKYFYYMDINIKFENNYLPFDENNNLVLKNNFYIK